MDNATFDRLARLLGGGASRRQTLRAILAAALAGGSAKDLIAADKKKDKDKDKSKDRGKHSGRDGNGRKDADKDKVGKAGDRERVAAQGKSKNKRKRKHKKKDKDKGGNGNENGAGTGNCAGTPLQPGQDFLDCDFSGDNLREEDLHSSSFKDVDFSDADLCGANLESTSFADSDLSNANLTDVNLNSSSHSKTSFAGANLEGASLKAATFSKVDFSGADFTRANLTGATFADVDVSGAIFCQTVTPDGDFDNRDCDACDNACGVCQDCDEEDCEAPDCCPAPEGSGGICVDLESDPLNCGSCDRACDTNLSNACVDGECVCGSEPECGDDEACCRGESGGATACVDVQNDVENCGACGAGCETSLSPCVTIACIAGVCTPVGVADGAVCDAGGEAGICCERACVDADNDRLNCGGCEVACLSDTTCIAGDCVPCAGVEAAVCGNTCLTPGPGVCCIVADCPNIDCQLFLGCEENVCQYEPRPEGADCGFGGTCTGNQCIGQTEG